MTTIRLSAAIFVAVIAATIMSAEAVTYTINNQSDFEARQTATYAAGDIIQFKRGAIFTGMFAPQGSGTPTSPIRIEATGTGEKPIINAMGTNTAAILLKNVECWEIDGIEITNTYGETTDLGIFGIRVLIDSTPSTVMRHYHISNCFIHDVNKVGIGRYCGAISLDAAVNTLGNVPFRLDDMRVTGNTIQDCGGVGIGNTSAYVTLQDDIIAQLWTNVYVAHNYVSRTGRNGIIGRISKDAVYEYNTLSETSRYNTGHSLYNYETSGFIAQHNEAFGNLGTGTVDRGGFDADYNSKNTTYQYNYSHNNHWFMGIMCRYNKGITIRYNISQDETKGIYWYGFDTETPQLENVIVHNNVHYTRAGLTGVQFIARNQIARNTAFYNNIFHFAGSGSYGSLAGTGEGVSFSHNLFYNIPVWPYGSGDANAIVSDPRFVSPGTGGSDIVMSDPNRLSGYRLQANSPCINAGRTVSGMTRDFWGNPAPADSAPPDIGVYESQLPTVYLTVNDATAGEFGTDQTLAFQITRSGGTISALSVPLTASGSASPGTDYSGFVSPFVIPAGNASAVIYLTALSDLAIEGAETIGLTLGSSINFTPGTPITAEATIDDRPLHAWLYASVTAGTPSGPNDDSDGDGEANLLEYYKGTLPGNAASRLPVTIAYVNGTSTKVRFPRAKNRPDVSGTVRWSSDLLTWHSSGVTVNGLTVTMSQQVVSPPADDPETIEATATLSGPAAPTQKQLFFRLEVSD